MKSIKAVIVDKCKVEIQEEEIDIDKVSPNEIIIKNLYSMISAGTELANYTALDKGVWEKGSWNAYPYIPGYGAVGEVIKAGNNFPELKKGDKIFYIGKHVSLERYNRGFWVFLPEKLSPVEGAFLRMGMVSIAGLNKAELYPNLKVAVIGLGVIGNICAQLFSISGCEVMGFDLAEKRVKIAKECGIEGEKISSGDEAIEIVKRWTDGAGADIVIEAVGDARICEYAIKMVKNFGEMIILGSPRADYNTNITPFLRDIHLRWVTVKGALEWCVPDYPQIGFKHSLKSNYLTLCDLVIKNKLKIKPLITHVIPGIEIEKAYEGLLNKKDEYIGVVLDWTKI